jgi:hypothetical protein
MKRGLEPLFHGIVDGGFETSIINQSVERLTPMKQSTHCPLRAARRLTAEAIQPMT